MSNGDEFYHVIAAANLELQNLLQILLSIYAEEHARRTPPAPGCNALHGLLTAYITPLKEAVKGFAGRSVFTSDERTAIYNTVDIKELDGSVLLNILLKVKQILGIDRKVVKCHYCIGKCCTSCNHESPTCKKCESPKKKDKCQHKCANGSCNKTFAQCDEIKTICCTGCGTCLACRKEKFQAHIQKLIHSAILPMPATPSSPPTPPTPLSHPPPPPPPPPPSNCFFFTFIHCLELAEHFRNLFAHLTIRRCGDFLNRQKSLNENFDICVYPQQFEKYIKYIFECIIAFAASKAPSKTKELNKTREELNCIFQQGKSLKKYMTENQREIKAMMDVVSKMKEIEENLLDNQNINKEQIISELKESENNLVANQNSKAEEIMAAQSSNTKEVINAIKGNFVFV